MAKLPRSYVMAIAAAGVAASMSWHRLAVTLAPSQTYPINDDVDDPAVWGQDLPAVLRALSQDCRHAAHQAWRQRS